MSSSFENPAPGPVATEKKPTPRRVYWRRRLLVFGAASIALAGAFYLPLTLLAPAPQAAPIETSYAAAEAIPPAIPFPPYGAAGLGAIGYEGVLASSGTSDALPIASISKVVTALVVLEEHPLEPGEQGPIATLGALDEQFYAEQIAQDGIVAPVSTGQTISERNMLDLALMASANNYAQSVAAWAFGSEAAYVEAAASWLERNGLSGTTITDATGIQPTNTSTVADLIELARIAVAHPVVAEIVATSDVEVPGIGLVSNRNGLLGIDGVDGIKTGTLDESGACLLFSADHIVGEETITLVGVVLGGPDHDTINGAIRGLLAEANRGFEPVQLTTAGEIFATYETEWGDTARGVTASEASILTWTGLPVTAEVETTTIGLSSAGSEVGSVTFTVGAKSATVPLVLDAPIDDPGPWWRLGNPGELF